MIDFIFFIILNNNGGFGFTCIMLKIDSKLTQVSKLRSAHSFFTAIHL